jgi:hypothetical protein
MQKMTYDEMRQVQGGDYACAIASVGLATAEIGLITAIPSGGLSLFVAGVGASAALYGFFARCFG